MTGRRRFLSRRRDDAESARLEAILDGRTADDGAVGRVLGAARAQSGHEQPPGLDAALAEFRRGAAPGRTTRTRRVWRRALATTLTTKIVAGVTAAAAATGITVATTHRTEPRHRPPVPTPSTSSVHTGHSGDTGSPSPSERVPSSPASSSAGSTTGGSVSASSGPSSITGSSAASTSLSGLCRAWLANPGKHADLARTRAFQVLVSAAGGVDSVTGYCIARSKSATQQKSHGRSPVPSVSLTSTADR